MLRDLARGVVRASWLFRRAQLDFFLARYLSHTPQGLAPVGFWRLPPGALEPVFVADAVMVPAGGLAISAVTVRAQANLDLLDTAGAAVVRLTPGRRRTRRSRAACVVTALYREAAPAGAISALADRIAGANTL